MKTAIILHGMPTKEDYFKVAGDSESNCHWLPWIQKQLIIKGVLAQTPEMPTPYEPSYEAWCSVFEQFHPNEDTLLIGHSLGAGFLVRWLSEHTTVKTGPVILVAPWMDPDGEEKSLVPDFFNFKINSELTSRTKGLTIFYSTDDGVSVIKTAEMLVSTLANCNVKKFDNKGHFCFKDLGTREFPELFVACGIE